MKKLLFSTVLISFTVISYAQVGVDLGLKGGLNVTNLSSDANATYDSRTGFHGGLYALIKVANIGIQPELLYSQQGTEVNFDQAVNDFEQDYTYLNIPVMLKFYLAGGLNLQGGPQFGVLLSADGTTLDENGQPATLSKDNLENSDISGAIGLGWDAPFGLNLTARYVLGLSDINKHNFEAKNRMFQLSVGFRLFEVGN